MIISAAEEVTNIIRCLLWGPAASKDGKGKDTWRSQGCCSVYTQHITMKTPCKLAAFLSIISTPRNILLMNREDSVIMERMRGYGWWKELAEGSIPAPGRHLLTTFLRQSVSTCVSSHMPRQKVQICLVTWSILCCPINNRHNLSCQEHLIRGWSLCLDAKSWNTNPIRWKLNVLWTQFPLPTVLLRAACVNMYMMPARRQSSFWETCYQSTFGRAMDSPATWGMTKTRNHPDVSLIKAMRPKLLKLACSAIPLVFSSSRNANQGSCLFPLSLCFSRPTFLNCVLPD